MRTISDADALPNRRNRLNTCIDKRDHGLSRRSPTPVAIPQAAHSDMEIAGHATAACVSEGETDRGGGETTGITISAVIANRANRAPAKQVIALTVTPAERFTTTAEI